MTPHAVPPPEHRTAEGLCDGIPYDTDLVSINGVAIHFWYGDRTPTPEEVQPVLATARRHPHEILGPRGHRPAAIFATLPMHRGALRVPDPLIADPESNQPPAVDEPTTWG
jgi:hypothetical protein